MTTAVLWGHKSGSQFIIDTTEVCIPVGANGREN